MSKSTRGKSSHGSTQGAVKHQHVQNYTFPETPGPISPDVGTQAQFRKKLPSTKYRYDSSLSPTLDWDATNPAREEAEELIERILKAETLQDAQAAAERLKKLSRPFLNWTGKAERLSFEIPTLPLFTHERLSTRAIIETLRRRHDRKNQLSLVDNFYGDPHRSVADQLLRPYEHADWVNKMILGDSLVVMNSMIRYQQLSGQVQMIYIDPPYGVKFGSNFQPFVRKRDVSHNDDQDMTREPEMVQAYRDTWELGLHSYLTYLRDRLLLARELLSPTGSIFVQISDDNLHHVREVMDEVFGEENFVSMIAYTTSGGFESTTLSRTGDYLLWYSKNKEQIKYRALFQPKSSPIDDSTSKYDQIELPDGSRRAMTTEEKKGIQAIPQGARIFRVDNLISQGSSGQEKSEFEFQGQIFNCGPNNHWKASVPDGMNRLAEANRIIQTSRGKLGYIRYFDDFPVTGFTNLWVDIGGSVQSRSDPKIYVVQTGMSVVQRCILMATDPGDLVLDPTCGSGTTAYVAEQWGRRWITIDTSRVPLALARQRLLTATFPYYKLQNSDGGPAGGFVYQRKRNAKGEEVGGIVPHVTLRSIANNEPPAEEVLVDRPEILSDVIRVTGPFAVEATIPTSFDWEASPEQPDLGPAEQESHSNFVDRMIDVLGRSPVLRLPENRTVTFKNVRKPVKTLSLSAEALVENGESKPVAFVFGPENGAISEGLVFKALQEANLKSYAHLYVIGFAVQPNARKSIEQSAEMGLLPATYVQATPDLLMSDLLKHMRSSQIFSVAGLPEVELRRTADGLYQVELLGLDVFDPVTMEVSHQPGNNVPAWLLDIDYDDLCFRVGQAFFPRTSAWDNLKKALKGELNDSVWEHLSGTTSEPFEAGNNGKIAVKVIDDRGNELLVVKQLQEAITEKKR